MKALLCEIWICLLIAFLLGALVGWLLKCLCCKKKLERLEHEYEAKLAAAFVAKPSTATPSASINTAMSTPAEPAKPSVASTAPMGLLSAEPTDKDDLKRVSGIGPVFERVLNGLGVYKFEQIANFDEENIQWVAEHIETFSDRIYTDRWVEQAAELAKEVANK